MTGDWTWLLYAAFACMLGRGWWIARRPKKPLPGATLAFDALVPLLHEAAEQLLGEDYIAGSLGRVEAGWGSQHVVALAALQSKPKEV